MRSRTIGCTLGAACFCTLVLVVWVILLSLDPTHGSLRPSRTHPLPGVGKSIALSPDGRFVAVGTRGTMASLMYESQFSIHSAETLASEHREVQTPQWVSILQPVTNPPGFLAALTNQPGQYPQESRPGFGSIELFPLSGVQKRLVSDVTNPITSIAVSPGERLLAVCGGGTADVRPICSIYSLPKGGLITTFSPVSKGSLHAAFPNDSRHCLVLRGRDWFTTPQDDLHAMAFLISTEDAELLDERQLDDGDFPIYSVCRPRNDPVALISSEKWIGQCEVQSGKIAFNVLHEPGAPLFEYHAGSNSAAWGSPIGGTFNGSRIGFLDVSTGTFSERRIVTRTIVWDMVFSEDGDWLYTVGADGTHGHMTGVLEKYDLRELK